MIYDHVLCEVYKLLSWDTICHIQFKTNIDISRHLNRAYYTREHQAIHRAYIIHSMGTDVVKWCIREDTQNITRLCRPPDSVGDTRRLRYTVPKNPLERQSCPHCVDSNDEYLAIFMYALHIPVVHGIYE